MTEANGLNAAALTKSATARPWRVWAMAGTVVLVVAVLGYLGWEHMARPVSGRLESLVQLIATDPAALPAPDSRGRVPLTGQFSGVTPRDEMFLTRRSDGSFAVLFPTYYGSGTSIACLLYTSRPLLTSDTRMRQPTFGKTERVIDVLPYLSMQIDGRVDEHWYRVSYDIH